jgi:outer membrane protein TolC
MNTRVVVAGFLVASLSVITIARAQTASVLTIDDAVALALKGNRQVQSAALDVARATEDSAALKTTRLPQFQIYAIGGEALRPIRFTIPQGALGSYAATGPIPGQSANVSTPREFAGFILGQAAQPLSQLWKIHLALISSRISEDLAKEKLRQQRQDTAQSVRDVYYQIAQTQSQVESAKAMEKYLVELQGQTDRQLLELAVLKGDSLAVRARLSQQRYQLLNLRDAGKTQKESLNRLLGRDLETELSVEVQPLPTAEEIDLAAAHNMALGQRPEMQEARLQTKKAETEVRRQRAEYIPDISVGFTYASEPNVSFAPQNLMMAGFLMQWQPFDWGQKHHKTQALRDISKQSTLAERDTEQQILLDVNSKFRALAEARVLLDTSALAQEAQREKLRELTNQYREKAVLLSDVLQQEGAMVQADSEYQSALAAFWKTKAGFDRALGRE